MEFSIGERHGIPCDCLVYEWRIKDIPLLSYDGDEFFTSPSFQFASESWNLCINPYVERNDLMDSHSYDSSFDSLSDLSYDTSEYIGLYLERNSSGSPITVDFTLGMKTLEKELNFKTIAQRNFAEFEFWGWHYFVKRQSLMMRMSDLIVVCEIKLPKSARVTSETCEPVPSTSFQTPKLFEDLKQMFLKKENCDVVLTVKGSKFPAHKSILAARSPVLKARFRNNMREKKTKNIKIKDCDPSSFSEFLSFVYCGEAKLSQENMFNLYYSARKYHVADLRSKCVDFMKENLSVEFFCETIAFALKYRESELINSATDFFVKNAKNIVKTPKWQAFVAENPTESYELLIKFIESA